jgi:hypothetical protein
MKKMRKKFGLLFCLLLSGCDVPLIFWEEEGRKVVDDFVEEEEKLHPQPKSPEPQQQQRLGTPKSKRIVKKPL